MAKQIEDTQTINMYGEPKRRGRPATGKAMSAAERKRAQRARDRKTLTASMQAGRLDTQSMTLDGLLNAMAEVVKIGLPDVAMTLAAELVRRASLNK